jgi:tetratricopeptide (TPR) repeat protein
MRKNATFPRLTAFCTVLFFAAASAARLAAQTAATEPPVTDMATTGNETPSQADLLKSYLRVQEELRAAQQALVNNRLEVEAAARAQAAAIGEKLDAIKVAMAAERERQITESQRQEFDRQRQQAEAEHSARVVLWIAASFGGVGSLAVIFSVLFQWRATNRVAEIIALRPPPAPLPAAEQPALPAGGGNSPAAEAVMISNQRLLSVIDRMERRIFELEHTAAQPPAATSAVEIDLSRRPAPATNPAEPAARIPALLGKGRTLLNANKAREALECYDEVLQLDPNHPEALVKKGAALERLKQDLDAIECYDRAIKADRKMTLAYLSKGGICNRLQRYDEAVECYELALQAQEVRPSAQA